MSVATIQGRTPAQLAGANSQPVAVRNISATAPVYIGFSASISPETADMVVLAGELFNSPADQPLWACTDTNLAASVIYNTSGTGVQLSGPTSVAINNKPPVTIPDGVAINGGVSVTGNVGINGSVAIAGDVNVLGTIRNKVQPSIDTLYNANYTLPYYYAGVEHGVYDVSSYAVLHIKINGNVNNYGPGGLSMSADGGLQLSLEWRDANDNIMFYDRASYNWNGGLEWTIPIRGARVRINSNGDRWVPNNAVTSNIRILGSSIAAPERYYSVINYNVRNAVNSWNDMDSRYGAADSRSIKEHVNFNANGAYGVSLPSVFSGRIKGSTYYTGAAGNIQFKPYVWDQQIGSTNSLFTVSALNTDTPFDLVIPRSYLAMVHNPGNGYSEWQTLMVWDNT